ncbi:MAG: hypothetical protein ACI9K2_005683, partial [Myxococcota bacterium]
MLKRIHPVPSDAASALTVRITGGITALTITPEGLAAGTDRGDVVGVADGREVYR